MHPGGPGCVSEICGQAVKNIERFPLIQCFQSIGDLCHKNGLACFSYTFLSFRLLTNVILLSLSAQIFREFDGESSSHSFEVVVTKNLDEGRKLTEKLYSVFAIWEDSVVSACSLSEEDPEEGLRNLCRYMCENYDYNGDGFPTIPGFIGSGGLWKAGLVKGMTDDNGNPDPRFGNGVNCDGSCCYINYFACNYLGCTSEPKYHTGGHVSEIVTTKDGTKYDMDCGMSGKKGSRLWYMCEL